ncbi:TPA: DNA cytosine methyltransferase [Vibrio harveyi]|nr:DNA cytosine methyltransferase [Vibrio harveyi]
MRIIDLFSGLGGLTVGALQAAEQIGRDFEIYLASDMDPFCSDFYQSNFRDYLTHFHNTDITLLDVDSLPKAQIDYLFAGPPCQGHSDLNNRSRRTDPRNNLYLETIKVIRHFMPTCFLIENVPTVVHSKQGVVSQLKEQLDGMYYVQELLVDFERLGIAQTRKRHILLGSIDPIESEFLMSMYEEHSAKTLRDVIHDLVDIEQKTMFDTPSRMTSLNKERAKFLYDNGIYDLPNYLRPKCHQGEHSYKSMYGRLNWNKPSQTITGGFGSMGQGRFLHPSRPTVLTPHEAARIQGLPDFLDFSTVTKRGALHQMIGNAVPPVLSKELIIRMER